MLILSIAYLCRVDDNDANSVGATVASTQYMGDEPGRD